MNNLQKRNEELKNRINVKGIKHPISAIIKQLITIFCFWVYNGTFYLKKENLITPISDRDVCRIIRTLLDNDSRLEIGSSTIKEITERLRDIPEIQFNLNHLIEKNKYTVLTQNGTFNVKNGTFNPSPSKDDVFLHKLNFNYIKNASLNQAPNFSAFTNTSLGIENCSCLLTWFGYSCTMLVSARKAMFLIGPEKCGKSLIIELMENSIGSENTSAVPFSMLSTEQSRIRYHGKIANLSREASAKPLKNEDAFKSLISGEKITGRRLYENTVEFTIYTKFTTASNVFPQFKNNDTAVLDRMLIIYFKDRLQNNIKTDYNLIDKIIKEKDIIFSMSLDSVSELIESNYEFNMSDKARNILSNKRSELLNVSYFLNDNFVIDTDSVISSVSLYNLYKEWCGRNGITPEGRNTFYNKVTDFSDKINRGKFMINNHNLNGFKGLKSKCTYTEKMSEQPYQDSLMSGQNGGNENE